MKFLNMSTLRKIRRCGDLDTKQAFCLLFFFLCQIRKMTKSNLLRTVRITRDFSAISQVVYSDRVKTLLEALGITE